MMRVPSTELQNNFGKYLKIACAQEPVIVTKNGRDVACITPRSDGLTLSEPEAVYDAGARQQSYQDYLEFTERSDERYELIDGIVYLLASPDYIHQTCVVEILRILSSWFKGKACRPLVAPLDVTLRKGAGSIHVVQPDILVICDPENLDEKRKYRGIPALVVEILSPATRRKDLTLKLDLYVQSGIKEYWLVDPDKRTIHVYSFEAADIVDYQTCIGNSVARLVLFTGLEIPLADFFTFQHD